MLSISLLKTHVCGLQMTGFLFLASDVWTDLADSDPQ